MKLTKLSLVAALAVSSAFAGGDIAPVEPVVEAPAPVACNSNTTINGKAVLYSYTWDNSGNDDWYTGDTSALGLAATLNVSHKIMDGITANFTAVGYTNLTNNYFEEKETGAFFNVANITATYADTTFVLGRQLLDTPMLGGFDWLLAPGAFEAYTVVNNSISNLTLVGSYVAKWRENNTDDNFIDLTDAGDHWTVGAVYSDAFDASIWYYNVDAFDYTQVYADAGVELSGIKLAAQYVGTDYGIMDDSTAYGIKASTSLAGFDLMAAYNNVDDNFVGYVGRDSLYTSNWNKFASDTFGDSYKIEAATEFSGLSVTASYAGFETDVEDGNEFDLILGYGLTDCISLDAIYTSTSYWGEDEDNALEFIATYKF